MIWVGISLHTKTQAVVVNQNLNAQRYQFLTIRPCVIPHVQTNRGMVSYCKDDKRDAAEEQH